MKALKLVRLILMIVEIAFIFFSLSIPNLRNTVYIGGFEVDTKQWIVCYAVYAIVMVAFFTISFFIEKLENK